MYFYIYRIFDAPGPELHGRLDYFTGTIAYTNYLGLETPKEAPVIDPQLDIRVKMVYWAGAFRHARPGRRAAPRPSTLGDNGDRSQSKPCVDCRLG